MRIEPLSTRPTSPRWILLLAAWLALFACNFPPLAATPLPVPASASPTASLPPALPVSSPLPASPTPFEPEQDIPASPTPTTVIAYQLVFEPAPCAFPVPSGTHPECGFLVVPENRLRPASPTIRLHVAVFRSLAADPAPDPVVHLAGGPGSSSLAVAGYLFRQGLGQILERRDFILFDQRGTGYSQPQVDCPEREALTPDLLDGNLSPAEDDAASLEAFRRCRERLAAAGIDLSAYNSAASAADVNDLRRALGYERLNLYGVSYGTRLALTMMRDYPQAMRSAVLDSTYPPQVHLYTSLAPNAGRAFNVLFARCASDPPCSAAYPALQDIFWSLVDQLNTSPVQVILAVDGVEYRVSLDGGLLIDVLFVGLYNRFVAATMPKMIFDIREGDYALLRERLSLYFDASSALGMQMAVQCAEEIPFAAPEDVFAAAQEVRPQIAAFFPAQVQVLWEVCRDWGLPPPDPRENAPVTAQIPSLVLAGELDPITPPDWGRLAASSLSPAYFYEFPAQGHWVTRSSSCALAMALAFWDDPAQAPDASCLQSEAGLDFVP